MPADTSVLDWEVTAQGAEGKVMDLLRVKQDVIPSVPVRVHQATLVQLDQPVAMPIESPKDALSGRGGVNVALRRRLSDETGGITEYMSGYPYTCLEQKVSKAIALRQTGFWETVMNQLPAHLDPDGLLKFFPGDTLKGDPTLTAYVLAVAQESGWNLPESSLGRVKEGLRNFVEGRVIRDSALPTADLALRKLAAIEALARYGEATPALLGSFSLDPNLWPTSAVIDWLGILQRVKDIPDQEKRHKEAQLILRSRLTFQGTTLGFSTEASDNLWWLMTSPDLNAVRALLTLMELPEWREDLPRLLRGALGRQKAGHWDTTTANAWGVLALEKFGKAFEATPVSGNTVATLGENALTVQWKKDAPDPSLDFQWPAASAELKLEHQGEGKPWAFLQSRAAIPLKEPLSSGYTITRTLAPVEQKQAGQWSQGDVARVRLELEAQSDMTWVVVDDPIPAGVSILGSGLGGDSQVLTEGEQRQGWVWPAYEERRFDAFRAYYEFVPKGKWVVEYTVRFNNPGTFELPPTRVEALYAPEMLGELPNGRFEVVGEP